MARILLGVSGGIAAYKSLEFARLATLAGHGVRVVMTEAAGRFVGAASFEGITGAPALTSEFERDPLRGAFPGDPAPDHDPIGHLELAANCDAYLVAPASANTLAKLAAGIADSMLTTSFLACTAPRLVAPAMNDRMYANPATQANLATLREREITVIEPDEGLLASRGEQGRGRLPDPARLLEGIEAMLPGGDRPWDGLRVLVTAGGTREPLDPVRFIGNRSSGRMGIALAAAAARRGAEVTLIAANVSLPEPAGREPDRRRDRRRARRGGAGRVPRLPRPPDGGRSGRLQAARGRARKAQARQRPRAPARADRGHPRRPRRHPRVGPDDRRLRRRNGRGREGASPREAESQGGRPDRPERRLRPGDRVREREQCGDPDRRRSEADVPIASKEEIAGAILDRVDSTASAGRKERAILNLSFFVPSSLEKWAWPTFFSPQITWKTSKTTSSSSFPSSIRRSSWSPWSDPGPKRSASSSTTPTGWTWRCANA